LAGAFEPIFTMTETRAGNRSGVALTTRVVRRNLRSRLRSRAESAGRSRVLQVNAAREEVLRSGRPLVDVTLFECWWPVARGNPAFPGRSSRELVKRPAPQGPWKWRMRAVPEGRNIPPSPVEPALSFRDTQREFPSFVHAGSSVGRRSPSLRKRTVRRKQTPAMGYGYRRGENLRRVSRWWERRPRSEPCLHGDGGLYRNPANLRSGTGMQQARNSRCGGNRRSGEIPQGRNANRGRHTTVRTRAQARGEWTHAGTSEEGTRQSQGREIFLPGIWRQIHPGHRGSA